MPAVLGNSQRPLEGGGRSVTVLVTGFGPWSTHDINPSWEIVKLLPPSLTVSLPQTSNQISNPSSPSNSAKEIRVNLIIPHDPLKVSYHTISSLIPQLIQETKPDLILHLGLASRRKYYALELSAPRTSTAPRSPDIDGFTWSEEAGEVRWPQSVFPDRLVTGLDYESIARDWILAVKAARELGDVDVDVDVRTSDDVGAYLCGFTYYSSLAHYWDMDRTSRSGSEGQNGSGPVLFLHVPPCETGAQLQMGREVTIRLIESMVVSWLREIA